MSKRIALLVVLGGVLLQGCGDVKARSLYAKLVKETDPAKTINLAADLLKVNAPVSRKLVLDWAEQSPLRSFDDEHSLLLVHDPAEGKTWDLTPEHRSALGPSADRSLMVYSGIHLAERNGDTTVFVLRRRNETGYDLIRAIFKGKDLGSVSFDAPMPEEIARWSRDPNWPKEWR
jgi:hypothetical protein